MTEQPTAYPRITPPSGLVDFEVELKETRLSISASADLSGPAEDLVAQALWQLETFVARQPRFAETWSPYEVPDDAPELVKRMAHAGVLARVGPMAAATGAIVEYVGRGLAELSDEVVVRIRGDVFLAGDAERTLALWAGDSPLTGTMGLRIPGGLMPVAVCTSAAIGAHRASQPCADAATVLSRDGALADAVATALANRVHTAEDIQRAIDACRAVNGVLGLLVVVGDHLGAWGNVHLTALEP